MAELSVPLFQTVRLPRASSEIVQQVEASIAQGKLAPGDRLPSVKELTEQFGLSRTAVRDALRILESQGLVSVKVGASGGVFVASPSTQPLSQVLTNMLRLQGITIPELVEARLVVETGVVAFAAERATSEDILAMQEAIDEARAARAVGESRFTLHSIAFHVALAQAAKSRGLLFTVNALRTPFHETLDKLLPDDDMALRAIHDHQAILDAIIARDSGRARDVMQSHISYFEKRTERLDWSKENLARLVATPRHS